MRSSLNRPPTMSNSPDQGGSSPQPVSAEELAAYIGHLEADFLPKPPSPEPAPRGEREPYAYD